MLQRKVAAATKYRRLGTRCDMGLLATTNNTKTRWVVSLHTCLYLSGSGVVIEDWGNITGIWTISSNRPLLSALILLELSVGIWPTSDWSIYPFENFYIDD